MKQLISRRYEMDAAQRDFLYCYGAITEVLRCGPPDLHTGHKVLVLVIPDAYSAADLDPFGLNGQIEHKLAFLRKHVPKKTKLILIVKAVMLFPTIERMAQTPQGKSMTPMLCHLRYLAYLSIFLLSLLPERLKGALVKVVLAGIGSLDRSVVPPAVGLLSGDSAANAVYMAGQEMRQVLERDNVTIGKNLEKLIFYYGARDRWCPVQYCHEIKEDFPAGDFRLCETGFRHAFVLDAGREVAKMLAEWIQSHLKI
ncbi:lipid droplet-associated hydrolase isoform X6 [Syngnathus typhle]|uniref:lipid droplet-associated hydrolase isoform X6 n=1 Tax=Syngnathus typhle TaxID=161592 RepID=UPI002A69FA6D|nr:lipid droplet-associated hydrolase isoform X6 [Syngnathus typhle]